jgi:hypothetical protein
MHRYPNPSWILAGALALLTLAQPGAAQEDPSVELSWLFSRDLGWEIVQPGQCRHLVLEASQSAYVAVFEWTPDDELILLQPLSPETGVRFTSNTPLPVRVGPYDGYCWRARRTRPFGAGLGYLIAVASPNPLDLAAGLDALGVPRRWGGGHYTARGATYNADHGIETLLNALGVDDNSVWVLGYAVER